MNNIIKFPESESFRYNTVNGFLELFCKFGGHDELGIGQTEKGVDEFEMRICDESVVGTRKQVAEFLWAAAYLLDSDQEWVADKYPCINK